ncbi:transcriptional Coactivator p15-domain-containing protein [Syncephalis fuscata]|nr:transcriptional Coactivator p15-domain-containing protein [Syncephalis fuscata]
MSKRALSDEYIEEPEEGESTDSSSTTKNTEKKQKANDGSAVESTSKSTTSSVTKNSEGDAYFRLGAKKRLTIRKWKTMVLIDFREYFTDAAGEERPTKKGLSLTKEQWEILKSSMSTIDQVIDELK